MIDSIDVHDLLEAWGAWVLADGNGLGYSSPMATLMRKYVVEHRRCKRRFVRHITDDDALKIERYVTKLCQCRPFEGKLLKLKYIDRMGDNTIAREYLTPLKYGADSKKQVSAAKVASYIAHAEGVITGLMFNDSPQ